MDKNNKEHKFWDNTPMMKPKEVVKEVNDYIEDPDKISREVLQDKLPLLSQFEWSDIDVEDPKQLEELYVHLRDNFGEDSDSLFRFHYSKEFLLWSLNTSKKKKELHIGVRVVSNKKLVGFIAGTPTLLTIYGKNIPLVEINYLCIHKKLRNKRLAPILIQEVARRVPIIKIYTAIYTFGQDRMKYVSKGVYWHRFLDIEKCLDTKFFVPREDITREQYIRLYRIEKNKNNVVETNENPRSQMENPPNTQMVTIDRNNINIAYNLYLKYITKLDLSVCFTLEEFTEHILPKNNVIYSYITEDNTSFFSFFRISSTVLTNCKHTEIRTAHLYYHSDIKHIMNIILLIAKQQGFDVLTTLDIMDNNTFLKDNKFASSNVELKYYLYNWRCKEIPRDKLGVILH